jgi:capsular exopolysaccharide synthesis family protein
MATMLGFAIPFLFVFLLVFFDTKVHTINDIKRLSKIPILGVVGKSTIDGNLVVLDKSKSSIAEAFRTIRASLQFIYKKQGIEGTKTVLVTSSVSGEGKTFCSINLASVFALSEKKTILVGLDLRKPKIFGDFNLDNDIGVVNYLIQDRALNAIIQKTRLEHLDVISSGPIPPNPSELLMSDRMELLIEELKEQYDYIVLDSPPLGLVSDSLGLIKFADATIYVVRQNYTKRGMFSVINEKYKRGEVTNLSFVLNSFEDKTKNGYGYGYGYGYYDDERKPSLWVRAKRLFKRK